VAKTQEQITAIRKTAQRKATSLCVLGWSVAWGQFAFIAGGSFHYYSWDIMEPICYLMTFGNMTAGFAFYLGAKKDLELNSVHESLTERFVRRACDRKNISLSELEADIETLKQIEKELSIAYSLF